MDKKNTPPKALHPERKADFKSFNALKVQVFQLMVTGYDFADDCYALDTSDGTFSIAGVDSIRIRQAHVFGVSRIPVSLNWSFHQHEMHEGMIRIQTHYAVSENRVNGSTPGQERLEFLKKFGVRPRW